MYAKPLTNTLEAEEVMFAPLKEHGIELLKHDPEFVIDRIGIVTPEGDGYIKGVVKLKGATAEDFGDAAAWRSSARSTPTSRSTLSEKMIQKFPNGSTGAGATVDAGYAKREGRPPGLQDRLRQGRAHRERQTPGNSGTWRSAAGCDGRKLRRRRSRIRRL